MKDADKKTLDSGSCLTRRGFLKGTAGATLAITGFPTLIPSSVLGKDGAVAPSNRIVVGFIGVGPQGQGVMGRVEGSGF